MRLSFLFSTDVPSAMNLAGDVDEGLKAEQQHPEFDSENHEENTASTIHSVASTPMSKSALKKMIKREKTLQGRKLKKLVAKTERQAKAVVEGRNLLLEQQDLAERTATGEGWRRRQEIWEREKLPLAQHHSFQICIDCAYEEHMTAKEIASLASQIRCCYAYNKRNPHPCLFTVTGLSGQTLELLQKETGYSEWHNRAYTGTSMSLSDHFHDNLHNLVYLTSDSENSIAELDNGKIYVIGGIVDRNRLVRAARTRADKLGIPTAKLPLSEHLAKMPTTRVLTCNHVFDILLRYRLCGNDWCEALRAVLPPRKEAEFRTNATDAAAEEET
jgi:tRNA (guanine9-N1)-methyltransferase